MIIDTLSIAGILATVFYLLTFAWFGRETLRVEEVQGPNQESGPGAAVKAPCPEC